jgi:Tfp pilus assembly protein PilF
VLNNLAVNLAHQGRYEEAEQIMAALEERSPDDPYADLHRAKIFAAQGKRRDAYRYLERALKGSRDLDTMHHIEFRQDIRLDPAFKDLRHEDRFARLLRDAYGSDADELLRGPDAREGKGG